MSQIRRESLIACGIPSIFNWDNFTAEARKHNATNSDTLSNFLTNKQEFLMSHLQYCDTWKLLFRPCLRFMERKCRNCETDTLYLFFFQGCFVNNTIKLSDKYNLETYKLDVTPADWTFLLSALIYLWQGLWLAYGLAMFCRRTAEGPYVSSVSSVSTDSLHRLLIQSRL